MTTEAPLWAQAPEDWPEVAAETIATAKERALLALADDGPDPVGRRLADYYDVDGNYVGVTFATVAPNEWHDVTGADVLAVLLMNGEADARTTRRLLAGPHRTEVVGALRRLPAAELLTAGPDALAAMERFYRAVKAAFSNPASAKANPWVSASKFCARKRPELFPVRDRVVCSYLGIAELNDFRADWLVFRALIQDAGIQRAIAGLPGAARDAANGRHLEVDDLPLRLLDAGLWTYARRGD